MRSGGRGAQLIKRPNNPFYTTSVYSQNLSSTSGKGLQNHIVTAQLYQMTLKSIGTFGEPEQLEQPITTSGIISANANP